MLVNAQDWPAVLAGAEALQFDTSGRVGVGTDTPTKTLDVAADSVHVRTAKTPASSSAP